MIGSLLAFLIALFGFRGEARSATASEPVAPTAPSEEARDDTPPPGDVVEDPAPAEPEPVEEEPAEEEEPSTPPSTGDQVPPPPTGGDVVDEPAPVEPDPVEETPVEADEPASPPSAGDQTPPPPSGGGDPVVPRPPVLGDDREGAGALYGEEGQKIVALSANGTTPVSGGRVTTLSVPDSGNAVSVRITELPQHGNVTVNPDNTLALVLSGSRHEGALKFGYEVTYADGSTVAHGASLKVAPLTQGKGWGAGDHYTLRVDENGRTIVEHGDDHRKVYVSNSDDALTRKDIAALEGLSDPSRIDAKWLAARPEYGGSEDMALAPDLGVSLWQSLSGQDESSSDWLLFERGYEYQIDGRLVGRGEDGESPLHPLHITSYGEGADPVLRGFASIFQSPSENVVFSGVHLEGGLRVLGGRNFIFDDVTFSGGETVFQGGANHTVRNSDIIDVYRDKPKSTEDGAWTDHNNRISGLYAARSHGLLIEGTYGDQLGWEEGFDYNRDAGDPQPPSMYSHGFYVNTSTSDVTFRDNIVLRGASHGAQVRAGGFFEDNALIDNNIGLATFGAKDTNFALLNGNLVTSAAHKTTDGQIGGVSMGLHATAFESSLIDNLVVHAANPNDPSELDFKRASQWSLALGKDGQVPHYNDTLVYNWKLGKSYDPSEVTNEAYNATTIQNFTAELLGKPDATIDDLSLYMRQQGLLGEGQEVTADDILAWFRAGFDHAPGAARDEAATVRFVPNDLGEGFRWDNRLNWKTGDLPGAVAGDSVDLGGNWVSYAGTTTIENLDFGSGGALHVAQGYLDVDGALTVGDWGGTLTLDRAGQFWTDGYKDADTLNVEAEGGRFANTGEFHGATDFTIRGGQAILATGGADFVIGDGSRFEVDGRDSKVGFDGDDGGIATLRLDEGGTLRFEADAKGFSTIEEFRSGFFGDGPKVLSAVDLGSGTLELDLSQMTAATQSAALIEVDELVGSFGAVDVKGLGGNRDATLTIDYTADRVTLALSEAGLGSGALSIETVGDEGAFDDVSSPDEAAALWAALTADHGVVEDAAGQVPADEEEILEPL